MLERFSAIAETAWELIAPTLCESCGCRIEAVAVLCAGCRRRLERDDLSAAPGLTKRAAYRYVGETARTVVHRYKYRGVTSLAHPLATEMARVVAERPAWRDAALVPVPQTSSRRRLRGHDPAKGLAVELADIAGVPMVEVLFRRAHSSSQTTLSLSERRRDMKNEFAASRSTPFRPVLLVDDVWTTGSTLDACCEVLCDAGFQVRGAVTAFRTPRSAGGSPAGAEVKRKVLRKTERPSFGKSSSM